MNLCEFCCWSGRVDRNLRCYHQAVQKASGNVPLAAWARSTNKSAPCGLDGRLFQEKAKRKEA